MSDIVEELRKGVQYDGYSLITEAEDTMNEAADIIDKLVEALEQIIEFRGARTYYGDVVSFDLTILHGIRRHIELMESER